MCCGTVACVDMQPYCIECRSRAVPEAQVSLPQGPTHATDVYRGTTGSVAYALFFNPSPTYPYSYPYP